MMLGPLRLLGVDEDRRPVILRSQTEGAALQRVQEQAAGPRYLPPAWVQVLLRSPADIEDDQHALQLGERADQARAWSDHQADRSGWGR